MSTSPPLALGGGEVMDGVLWTKVNTVSVVAAVLVYTKAPQDIGVY